MADERRFREQSARQTSPNPAVAALQSLNGSVQPMSHPADGPQQSASANSKADKMTKPLITIPDQINVTGDNMQTSPVSLSSFGDGDAPNAPGAPATEGASAGNAGREGASQQQPQQQHHQQTLATRA